jgi:hypothetical protein
LNLVVPGFHPGEPDFSIPNDYWDKSACIYGRCSKVGYGLLAYLTIRKLSTMDAPQILLSTRYFVKDVAQIGNQDVYITFNSSQAFFDYAHEDLDLGSMALNNETSRMNNQRLKATILQLRAGLTRPLTVGVLAADRSIQYVNGQLSCSAKLRLAPGEAN